MSKRLVQLFLLFLISIVGVIFVIRLDGNPIDLWGGLTIRDLLGYVFFGIPLFLLLLTLYRFTMEGKTSLFYITSIIASLGITIFLWALKFRGVNLISHLEDFFWIFAMILVMLILPVQLVRFMVIMLNRNKRS